MLYIFLNKIIQEFSTFIFEFAILPALLTKIGNTYYRFYLQLVILLVSDVYKNQSTNTY